MSQSVMNRQTDHHDLCHFHGNVYRSLRGGEELQIPKSTDPTVGPRRILSEKLSGFIGSDRILLGSFAWVSTPYLRGQNKLHIIFFRLFRLTIVVRSHINITDTCLMTEPKFIFTCSYHCVIILCINLIS
jgi:hypothetical protein